MQSPYAACVMFMGYKQKTIMGYTIEFEIVESGGCRHHKAGQKLMPFLNVENELDCYAFFSVFYDFHFVIRDRFDSNLGWMTIRVE